MLAATTSEARIGKVLNGFDAALGSELHQRLLSLQKSGTFRIGKYRFAYRKVPLCIP
jgi:hypothetical protein